MAAGQSPKGVDGTLVRTVTASLRLARGVGEGDLRKAATARIAALFEAARALEQASFEVQTLRLVTNSFEEWAPEGGDEIKWLAEVCSAAGTGQDAAPPILINIGPARTDAGASRIPSIINTFPTVTATVEVPAMRVSGDPEAYDLPDLAAVRRAAKTMKAVASATTNAEGCFNFAALAAVPPGCPYFPAAFDGPPLPASGWIAAGLQHAGRTATVLQAAAAAARAGGGLGPTAPLDSTGLEAVTAALRSSLAESVGAVNAALEPVAGRHGLEWRGIDTSLAPAPSAPSIVTGLEALGWGPLGGSGSILLASLLTRALRGIPGAPQPPIGYSGLMLPPLEDTGLALRCEEGTLRVRDLLTLSSVCGIGLDTVPVPGAGTEEEVARVIADVAGLAWRLCKPLSVRLFPVPGKRAGDRVTFDNPHLCDGVVLEL